RSDTSTDLAKNETGRIERLSKGQTCKEGVRENERRRGTEKRKNMDRQIFGDASPPCPEIACDVWASAILSITTRPFKSLPATHEKKQKKFLLSGGPCCKPKHMGTNAENRANRNKNNDGGKKSGQIVMANDE
ncbi:3506_t:CDS:2, partial [Acaulospora colombiana]